MKVERIRVHQTFTVRAPMKVVWDCLRDVTFFSSCIPALEQMEAVNDKTFRALVSVKIALTLARFEVMASIVEEEPPQHLSSVLTGEDIQRGARLEMRNTLDLRVLSETETEVSYSVEGTLSGKLATLGGGIAVKLKAMQMGKEFAKIAKEGIERRWGSEVVRW